jgi:chemotaxis protein methyltransferase CheR
LRFDASNRTLLEAGLMRAAEASACDVRELLARLESKDSDALLQLVVRHVTIGETYFFRHPEHFAALRERALPALTANRQPGDKLRAWSAGCANGEEAWSLAMVLAEAWPLGNVEVLGTDINRAALDRARAGRYSRWSLRSENPMVSRWLDQRDEQISVAERLRPQVRFNYLNLRDAIYPSLFTGTNQLDVIFCRNVLVYFLPAAAAEVLRRFRDCLSDGGWLVVSALDALDIPDGLERHTHGATLLLRKPAAPTIRVAPRTSQAAPPSRAPVRSDVLLRAKHAADKHDLDAAIALVEDALAGERSTTALHLYALVLGEHGRAAEQARVLQEIIERNPEDVLAHLYLGLASTPGAARTRELQYVGELCNKHRDEELLPGADPLPVAWVRKMAKAAQ